MVRGFARRRALAMALCSGLFGAGIVTTAGAARAADTPIFRDTHYSFEERAADLVSRLTLTEKAQQLSTNSAPAIPRLGVQQYTYWSEGQHGVNTLGANTDPGSASGGIRATSFPTNFAAAMSWDRDLIYRETTAISDEARGFLDKSLWGAGQNNLGPSASDYGSLTFWAPTVNLDRDPRWGRTDEAFGEDPYLVAQLAGAFVNGYQGQRPDGTPMTGYLKVAATAKHYALNDVENDRTGISSNVDDRTLREYYTAQFRALIEDAHVSGLMTSYNAINDTPAVADTYTVNQLAQRTDGFGGYITSDCGAVGTTYRTPPGGHDWAPPGWTTDHKGDNATWTNTGTGGTVSGRAGGQAYALRAGTGLNCTGGENAPQYIAEAIKAGVLSEGVVDTALVKIFTIRMRTGEFDPPDQVAYTKITKAEIESGAHQDLAEKVAANSLVLLKNDKPAGADRPLLPADGAKLGRVVILGDLANTVTLGGYSGEPSHTVNAVLGITSAVRAANPGASVVFDAAGTSTTATGAATLSAQTQADIKAADLVLVFAGTDDAVAHEGMDRTGLAIPGNYRSLIDQTTALGNPNLALVLQADGPVKLGDVRDRFPAILFSGYNGESQGTALADVLLGAQNPSGHLDFTWYADDSQLPAMADYDLTPGGTGGLGRTYQYFTGTPTYPFGYGGSYTTFGYSGVSADRTSVSADGTVRVAFDVTNTGDVPGATVAQLYAATPFTVSGVELPDKRLAGFHKTAVLQPGATEHVTLDVKVADLAFWDQQAMKDVVYDGAYAFQVASSASDVVATKTVQVTGGLTPKVRYVTVQPEDVVFKAGDTLDLTGKNRWIKDDTDPAAEHRDRGVTADGVVEAVNDDQSFVDLAHSDVQYASSDPSVATVSAAGLVKAVGDGVATIKVTVGGVTGTAPIVVAHSLTLSAPPVIAADSTATATTALTNGGDTALKQVGVTLGVPDGWTAKATSPSSFDQVDAGATVRTTWEVTAPAGTKPGSYALSATATSQGGPDRHADAQASVPYASFDAARNNTGISDDAKPDAGDLDGGGLSYSAQALAAAGLSAGTVQHGGLTFTWPTAGKDNIVAGGQAIALSGTGTRLGLLGTGDYGSASGGGLITYADGGTQPFSLGFADWWGSTPVPGGDVVVTAAYLNTETGRQDQNVSVYYASVPLQAGRAVRYVTLPDVSQGVATGQIAMHVFAAAVG